LSFDRNRFMTSRLFSAKYQTAVDKKKEEDMRETARKLSALAEHATPEDNILEKLKEKEETNLLFSMEACSFSHNGQLLMHCSHEFVTVSDITSKEEIVLFTSPTKQIRSCFFHPVDASRSFFVAAKTVYLKKHNFQSTLAAGEQEHAYITMEGLVKCVTISADGLWLMCSDSSRLEVWDISKCPVKEEVGKWRDTSLVKVLFLSSILCFCCVLTRGCCVSIGLSRPSPPPPPLFFFMRRISFKLLFAKPSVVKIFVVNPFTLHVVKHRPVFCNRPAVQTKGAKYCEFSAATHDLQDKAATVKWLAYSAEKGGKSTITVRWVARTAAKTQLGAQTDVGTGARQHDCGTRMYSMAFCPNDGHLVYVFFHSVIVLPSLSSRHCPSVIVLPALSFLPSSSSVPSLLPSFFGSFLPSFLPFFLSSFLDSIPSFLKILP
jgi:hypothetical protein